MIESLRESSPTLLLLRDGDIGDDHPLCGLVRGRRVIHASNAVEALTILEHNALDLVIIDQTVEGERAARVCEILRSCEFNADVPVLLTSEAHTDEQLDAYAAGADGLIALPLDPILAGAQIDAVLKLDRFGTRRRLSVRLEDTEAQLARLRESDSATGLPNAAMFESSLSRELARAERAGYAVGVLVVEFSNYDALGTVYPQSVLEQLMRGLGDRLSAAVRGRAVVGRLDSRCLVVCQPLPRAEEMTRAIHRYRRVLLEPYEIDQREIEVECSIGGSVYPADATDAERLIGLANSAMGHARHLGRNKYHLFDPTARAEAQRRLELESQIRRAIQAEGMLLHYQPRLRLSDGAVTGVEALLRLRDEDGELLSPNVFMAVAEDSGLMETLGLWAIRQACEDTATLREAGFDVRVAVNIAGDLFAKDTFHDDLRAAIDEKGIDGDQLELEISERAIDPTRHGSMWTLQERMTRIQRAGVRISLDNFGMGRVCLNDLRHLSIDNIKLSQDLISAVPDDGRMTRFVESLLRVGQSLNVRVIAQGVETQEQMTALRDMGCEDAQGFLFARPMSMTKLKPTLRTLIDVWESAYGQSHAAQAS